MVTVLLLRVFCGKSSHQQVSAITSHTRIATTTARTANQEVYRKAVARRCRTFHLLRLVYAEHNL